MGAGAYLGFRSADTVEELDPTQLANLAALTNDEGGSDCHYANGYKQWKIEKPVEKMIGKSYPQIVLHFAQKIVDKSQRKKFIAVCL